MFITTHHPNCKYFDPLGDTRALLGKLVAGIDAWASEEDGIHDAVYRHYTIAKLASGGGACRE
jgi:hypothetical protein